jgi:hypothetical protein
MVYLDYLMIDLAGLVMNIVYDLEDFAVAVAVIVVAVVLIVMVLVVVVIGVVLVVEFEVSKAIEAGEVNM